jgi:hypothetical protein
VPIERPPKQIAIRPLRLHGRRPISRTTPSFAGSLVRGAMEDVAENARKAVMARWRKTALCRFCMNRCSSSA